MKAVVYLEFTTCAVEKAAVHVKNIILQQLSVVSRDHAIFLVDGNHPLLFDGRRNQSQRQRCLLFCMRFLHKYSEALADAKKTDELKPDWSKGYDRLGAAHVEFSQYDDTIATYKKKGLNTDPNNEPFKSDLADAQSAASHVQRQITLLETFLVDPRCEPSSLLTRLLGHFLQQLDFIKIMQDIQKITTI